MLRSLPEMQFFCLIFALIMVLTICTGQHTDIYVPKGTNYFLNVSSNITLANATCGYSEVYVLIFPKNSKEENLSPRLTSVPLQEFKTGESIIGVITDQTKQDFQLGKVSFLCNVKKSNNSQDEFELDLKLEILIPEAATNHPLFEEIKLVVRCLNRSDVDSLGTIHEAGQYRLVYYYIETKKISPSPVKNPERLTKSPLSTAAGTTVKRTDLPLNSTLQTPTIEPARGDADYKNNLGMKIGIPVVIAVVAGVACICYRNRRKVIMHGKDKHTAFFFRKNNNTVERAENLHRVSSEF